jgi:hypothetical protein
MAKEHDRLAEVDDEPIIKLCARESMLRSLKQPSFAHYDQIPIIAAL